MRKVCESQYINLVPNNHLSGKCTNLNTFSAPAFAVHLDVPMGDNMAKKVEEEAKVHRIRITLTSCNTKDLEKGACWLP